MNEATPPEPGADDPKLRTEQASLASREPYTRPTKAELHDMLHGPRGQPILEIIEEYEQKYLGGESVAVSP